MKLTQIMKRGANKTIGESMGKSATMGPDGTPHTVRLFFNDPDKGIFAFGGLRYSVDLTRADAMKLRDYLNERYPESAFYDAPHTSKESGNV